MLRAAHLPRFVPLIQDHPSRWKSAALVILGGVFLFSLWNTIGKTEEYQDGDFGAYHRAARAVSRGETPYQMDKHGPLATFVYAPAYAYFFLPLGGLDYLWAARLWMVLNWGLVLACIGLGLRLVLGTTWRRQPFWPIVCLAMVPLANNFWANIRTGQAGTLMAAGCLGWAVCQRQGRSFFGGILLAAACAVKLAPCLLIPHLIVRRDWRGLLGVVAGSLALFAVPALWVGWEGTVRLHGEWKRHVLESQVPAQTYRTSNQSLLGQLARLPGISNGEACDSLESLSRLLSWYPLVVLLLAAVQYWWMFRSWRMSSELPGEQESLRENIRLSLLLIFMTLANPRAWSCNFVGLVLPCLILAERACRRLPGGNLALAALGLMTLSVALPSPVADASCWSWTVWIGQGKAFWGAIAVAGACLWAYHFACGECKRRAASRA
jgi:hypothetical protein